ncbi:hypothetical protein [Celeribacter sp.]|uniref:hypothetical protein n=1 Tax=Celeribacter sp. TaxID=1890673 RepID=UPI003A8E72F6
MIRFAITLMSLGLLVGCGVDGEPSKPVVTGKQTFGVNSSTGAYTNTQIGITFPAN